MKTLTSISKKEYEHLLAIRNIPIHHKEFQNTILIALFDIGNKSITEAYRSYVGKGNLSDDEILGKKRLEDVVLHRVKMELDSNGKWEMTDEDKEYTRYVRDIYDLNLLIEASIDKAKIALKTRDYTYANIQLSYAKVYIEDIMERPFRENEMRNVDSVDTLRERVEEIWGYRQMTIVTVEATWHLENL